MGRLRDELLIPFRGAGEAGRDLWAGTRVLVSLGGRGLRRLAVLALGVLRPRTGGKALEMAGAVVLAGVAVVPPVWAAGAVVWRVVARYGSWIAGAGVVGWVLAAWTVSPPRAEQTTLNDHEMSAGEYDTEPDPAEDDEPAVDPDDVAERMVHLVVEAIADAAAAGRAGVHLATLRTMLTEAGLPALEDVEALHTWLRGRGIPVARNLKVRGENKLGVRADALTASLGVPLREALAAPGWRVQEGASGRAPGAAVEGPPGAGGGAGRGRAVAPRPATPPTRPHDPTGGR
ncbi:hypothetical protein [Streptantibioticus cattleyicolor]